MLTKNSSPRLRGKPRKQAGVVLIIALIVLVAMTLAAIALVRSVDTNNIIAGNMAFQQAATHSGDRGVEAAINWLQTNNIAGGSALNTDDSTNGYNTSGILAAQNPAAGKSWDDYWTSSLVNKTKSLALDSATGNTVSYVIDRLCNGPGAPTGGASCIKSPVVTLATGNAEEAGQLPINSPSVVYYRITVRIAGPRNTVSYVQTVVAM